MATFKSLFEKNITIHIWNYLIVEIVFFYLRYVLLLALVKINQK